MATKISQSLYGSLVTLPDFTPTDDMPRLVQTKGVMKLSIFLPREILVSLNASATSDLRATRNATNTGGFDGIWILLDPRLLSCREVEDRVLSFLSRLADQVFIVQRVGGRPRIIRKEGQGGISQQILNRFFQGQTQSTDALGTWIARYIPDERGRYLIAGMRPKRFQGFLDQAAPFIRAACLLLLVFGSRLAFLRLALGRPLAIRLSLLVFAMFALTTVLPLAFVLSQGLSLAHEQARQAQIEWEYRLKEKLTAIDHRHRQFQARRQTVLHELEARLIEKLPVATGAASPLPEICAGLEKVAVLVHDENGKKLAWSRNLENLLDRGDYPEFQARYLARQISSEGRTPCADLTGGFLLVSGYALEAVINRLFNESVGFNRLRVRGRNFWQRQAPLEKSTDGTVRTIGARQRERRRGLAIAVDGPG
ncbi:MAG TPA: hypothetical protein PKO06_23300, partial [Candidatus Ozemobacteraceae bacterium]|nr:hypothetical protein [Candidatus Ozemobacteraceae bacterium]